MPLPYPKQEANSRDRAKQLLRGVPSAANDVRSGVAQHERAMHPSKTPTKLKLASGGVAEGAPACARMDRAPRARGGKAGKGKKATHVNVVVNAGQQTPDMPLGGLAAGAPPGLPPGPPVMPPPPPIPPKPMGPMLGGPPMGGPMPMPMRARGGKVYDAGAYSGEGRLEKIKNYGANAKIKNTTTAVKGVKGEGKAA